MTLEVFLVMVQVYVHEVRLYIISDCNKQLVENMFTLLDIVLVLVIIIGLSLGEDCFSGDNARHNVEQWIKRSIENCKQSRDCQASLFHDSDLTYIKVTLKYLL